MDKSQSGEGVYCVCAGYSQASYSRYHLAPLRVGKEFSLLLDKVTQLVSVALVHVTGRLVGARVRKLSFSPAWGSNQLPWPGWVCTPSPWKREGESHVREHGYMSPSLDEGTWSAWIGNVSQPGLCRHSRGGSPHLLAVGGCGVKC